MSPMNFCGTRPPNTNTRWVCRGPSALDATVGTATAAWPMLRGNGRASVSVEGRLQFGARGCGVVVWRCGRFYRVVMSARPWPVPPNTRTRCAESEDAAEAEAVARLRSSASSMMRLVGTHALNLVKAFFSDDGSAYIPPIVRS